MVSRRIVESAKFIKMPSTSQNLYFHLMVHADDDGIVEALPVINLIHANEDDLRVLHSKGFIVILNEDLVSFICDWLEHNKIRLDRKIDSIYLDLLLSVLPDVEIRRRREIPSACMTVTCLTDDGQMSAQDRTGQESPGEDNTGQDMEGQCSTGEPAAQLGEEYLTKKEYKDLADKYSEKILKKVLDKILDKPYPGCLNYETVSKWCEEQYRGTAVKKNYADNNERRYDYEELERKLLGM